MQTGSHPATLLSHVLAPAASKTPAVSLAQYAVSSWSRGGVILLIVIVVLVAVALSLIAKAAERRRG